MLPPIFTTLKASTDVKNIVGQNPPRIYRHGSAPERPDNLPLSDPYITWFVVIDTPENNLSSLPPVDRVSIQVDCWHQTDAGIELLAKAVRDALEPHAHMTGVPVDGKETETKLYRKALTFDYWLDR
jgi:hypothetical protein